MTLDVKVQTQLWHMFAKAIGAELRSDTTIRGASGLEHAVQAIAVDEINRRLIIISAEANPRIAALMQVDVQSTFSNIKVLVGRPIALDVPNIVRRVLAPLDASEFKIANVKELLENFSKLPQEQINAALEPAIGDVVASTLNVYNRVTLPAMNQIMSLAMQVQHLPWKDIFKMFTETASSGVLDLGSFMMLDSMEADLGVGVCPIPLYEFTEEDFEIFLAANRLEEATRRLQELGIYQYFYPPPDHVALGLIDQGLGSADVVIKATQQAPSIGHPFGDVELVRSSVDLVGVLDQLKERGYVAEGEQEFEISEAGKKLRSVVKFRPREGFLTKLIGRINFTASISPKDFSSH